MCRFPTAPDTDVTGVYVCNGESICSFEEGTLSFSEAAEERAKSYEQGRVLLTQLVSTARDLKLRCVGKNYDDANELFGGLENLLQQVRPIQYALKGRAARARRPLSKTDVTILRLLHAP